MTTLREAAQAVEAAHHPADHAAAVKKLVSLALSQPDPGGWEEGRDAAQAMKAALAGIAGGVYEDADSLRSWARDTLDALSRLPVPPSPVTAPEAKTAESEGPTHPTCGGRGHCGARGCPNDPDHAIHPHAAGCVECGTTTLACVWICPSCKAWRFNRDGAWVLDVVRCGCEPSCA